MRGRVEGNVWQIRAQIPEQGQVTQRGRQTDLRADLQDIRLGDGTASLDALDDALGELANVAVGRVEDDSDDGLTSSTVMSEWIATWQRWRRGGPSKNGGLGYSRHCVESVIRKRDSDKSQDAGGGWYLNRWAA
jgi:hypothetical protein